MKNATAISHNNPPTTRRARGGKKREKRKEKEEKEREEGVERSKKFPGAPPQTPAGGAAASAGFTRHRPFSTLKFYPLSYTLCPQCPLALARRARRVAAWGEELNAAVPSPDSPACSARRAGRVRRRRAHHARA